MKICFLSTSFPRFKDDWVLPSLDVEARELSKCKDNEVIVVSSAGTNTKKFELSDDYENVAVGSHLNVHFRYHLGLQYDISSNLKLKSGLNFHHFSNANMREPNLGLNMLSVSLGLSKAISKQEAAAREAAKAFL